MENINRLIGEETPRNKQSAYHGGFSFLDRLNELEKALDIVTIPSQTRYGIQGLTIIEHHQRLALLINFFKELRRKMSKDNKEKHSLKMKECQKAFDIARDEMLSKKTKINGNFIRLFDEWEFDLRDVVEQKGLLMPSKKGTGEASKE